MCLPLWSVPSCFSCWRYHFLPELFWFEGYLFWQCCDLVGYIYLFWFKVTCSRCSLLAWPPVLVQGYLHTVLPWVIFTCFGSRLPGTTVFTSCVKFTCFGTMLPAHSVTLGDIYLFWFKVTWYNSVHLLCDVYLFWYNVTCTQCYLG
jgi:hypothetical protein